MDMNRRGFLGVVGAALAGSAIKGEYVGQATVKDAPKLLREIGRGRPALWLNDRGFALLEDFQIHTDVSKMLMETHNTLSEEWVDGLKRQWMDCGFIFERGMKEELEEMWGDRLSVVLFKQGHSKLVGEGYVESYEFSFLPQDVARCKLSIVCVGPLREVWG
jgi:hypothetical protein